MLTDPLWYVEKIAVGGDLVKEAQDDQTVHVAGMLSHRCTVRPPAPDRASTFSGESIYATITPLPTVAGSLLKGTATATEGDSGLGAQATK